MTAKPSARTTWLLSVKIGQGREQTPQARRVFYIDEDNWNIAAVDGYDTRGNLWRVSEHLPGLLFEVPSCIANGSLLYDLVAGRYVITPAINEEKEGRYEHLGMPAEERTIADDRGLFKPDDLRRMGRR